MAQPERWTASLQKSRERTIRQIREGKYYVNLIQAALEDDYCLILTLENGRQLKVTGLELCPKEEE